MRHRRGASLCAVFLSPLRDFAPRVRPATTAAHTEFWPSERSLLPCQRISGALPTQLALIPDDVGKCQLPAAVGCSAMGMAPACSTE